MSLIVLGDKELSVVSPTSLGPKNLFTRDRDERIINFNKINFEIWASKKEFEASQPRHKKKSQIF